MYLLFLFGIFSFWDGMAWHVQNGFFRVLWKKGRQLEKSTPAVLVTLVTNNRYDYLLSVKYIGALFTLQMAT